MENRPVLRQSNFELLRIIAMLMIIAHHFAVHSGFEFSTDSISINRLWIQFIQLGGKIGVDVFVLISGYFLISQQSTKTSKIIKLWGTVFFYSVMPYAVFLIAGLKTISIQEVAKSIAPISFERWWFASCYFVFYLFVPYINVLLKSFDRKQYHKFLALLIILWSIIPTFTTKSMYSNDLLWFGCLYSIAGYFRLYTISKKFTARKLILLSLVGVLLTFMSAIAFDLLGTRIEIFGTHATWFYGMQQLPILIISVLIFLGFSKLEMSGNKLINCVSAATFGVYLIHDNSYVRPFLWKTIFQNVLFSDSVLLIPYSLIVIAVVFITCSIIELVRIHLIEKNLLPFIDKISQNIDLKLIPFYSKKIKELIKW